jgi:hypothetical protein
MHLPKTKNYHPVSEEIMEQITFKSKCKIKKVDVTKDTLTGRGGMALFVRYFSPGQHLRSLVRILRQLTEKPEGATGLECLQADFLFFL